MGRLWWSGLLVKVVEQDDGTASKKPDIPAALSICSGVKGLFWDHDDLIAGEPSLLFCRPPDWVETTVLHVRTLPTSARSCSYCLANLRQVAAAQVRSRSSEAETCPQDPASLNAA